MDKKNNFRKPKDESRLMIENQQFSDRNNLAKYIEWDALARISFVNCSFEKVHLLGKIFGDKKIPVKTLQFRVF